MGFLNRLFGDSVPDKQPLHLTDDNFVEEVLNSDVPVVVDFWGPGCPPCKKLEPVMMKLAGKYDGHIKVCEANTRENLQAVRRFKIRSTPSVLYFAPGGALVTQVRGFKGRLYHEEVLEAEFAAAVAGLTE
jgi:thioredoxin 1